MFGAAYVGAPWAKLKLRLNVPLENADLGRLEIQKNVV